MYDKLIESDVAISDIDSRIIEHSAEIVDAMLDNDELTHYGIKGQKWGIRNYQNKDGSLTPAGRKRYGSFSDAIKKYKKKKQLKKAREAKAAKEAAAKQRAEDIKQGRVKPKDMTADELLEAKKRLELERSYKQLFDQMNPPDKVVSEGKSFAQKMWNEAVKPALVTSGKTLLTDALNKEVKKIVGDKADKAFEKLKKEADEMDLKSKIQRAKKNIATDERQEWKQKRDFEADKQSAAEEAAKKNQERSAKEYEKTNSTYSKSYKKMETDNSSNDSGKILQIGQKQVSGLLNGPLDTRDGSVINAGQRHTSALLESSGQSIVDKDGNVILDSLDDDIVRFLND